MTNRVWLLLVLAAVVLTGEAAAQQTAKEPACVEGKILVDGKCVAKKDSGDSLKQTHKRFKVGKEPSKVSKETSGESVAPPRAHVPECKKGEVLVDKKCVPNQ